MRKSITRERAAMAVIEQALSKVLIQLALAQSTARVCDKLVDDELEDLISAAVKLRQRIVNANCLDVSPSSDEMDRV
jgi:hypothetical protein